jgi:hypothetical protein
MFRMALWILAFLAGAGAARAQAPAAELAGNWGLASYFQDKDYAKAKAAARAACAAPFTIRPGAGGAVMMYGPDDPALRPFVLRAFGGRTVLAAADKSAPRPDDRELRAPEPGVVTLTFLDRAFASRYGTEVLVRCGRK